MAINDFDIISVPENKKSPGKKRMMKSFRLGSISRNLYVLVMLAILPALAILLYSGLELRRQSIEHAQNQIVLLTHTMAEAQQDLTTSIKQMLATLALMPQVQNADREVCKETTTHYPPRRFSCQSKNSTQSTSITRSTFRSYRLDTSE